MFGTVKRHGAKLYGAMVNKPFLSEGLKWQTLLDNLKLNRAQQTALDKAPLTANRKKVSYIFPVLGVGLSLVLILAGFLLAIRNGPLYLIPALSLLFFAFLLSAWSVFWRSLLLGRRDWLRSMASLLPLSLRQGLMNTKSEKPSIPTVEQGRQASAKPEDAERGDVAGVKEKAKQVGTKSSSAP